MDKSGSMSKSVEESVKSGTNFFNKISKKTWLVVGVVTVLAVLMYYKKDSLFPTNGSSVLETMRKKNVKILAATWCGYCQKLKRELDALGDTNGLVIMHDKLSETDKKKWNVAIEGYPMFVQNQKKIVGVGYMPAKDISKMLSKV